MRIVRIKETIDYDEGSVIKVYLMYRSEYLKNPWKIAYRHTIKLHPYKWWQIWYLFEMPAFYIQRFLFLILKTKEHTKTQIAAYVGASIFDALIAYFLGKLIEKLM